jgi:hypothetical protein
MHYQALIPTMQYSQKKYFENSFESEPMQLFRNHLINYVNEKGALKC